MRSALDTAQIRRKGFACLTYGLAPHFLEPLRAEARHLRATATIVETDRYEIRADGQDFRSPMRFHTSDEGGALRAVHESAELCELATDVAGTQMHPSRAAYLFYEADDRIGLHTDLPACELVLLAALGAVAPPLVVHPELRSLTPEQLAEVAVRADGAPRGGVPVPLDDTAVVALFGGGLPHQTRPVATGSGGVVVTLCYVGPRE